MTEFVLKQTKLGLSSNAKIKQKNANRPTRDLRENLTKL